MTRNALRKRLLASAGALDNLFDDRLPSFSLNFSAVIGGAADLYRWRREHQPQPNLLTVRGRKLGFKRLNTISLPLTDG